MFQLDPTTPFGRRVERRLREEPLAWLTTVRANGTPEPSPIWFLWDGATMLIYSQPNQQKLRNISRNPHVAFNFDGDGQGGDIVIITGTATIDSAAPPANANAAYVEKYQTNITRIGMTAEGFAQTYSVAIRVTPEKLRGH